MARDRGVLLSDRETPCSATWSPSLPPPGSDALGYQLQGSGGGQCIIYFLGAEINTASFALYTFSLSVLVQAVLIISMSGAADHGSYRKTLLVIFAFIGSISTMLFLVIVPKVYLLGGLLAIISNTCFGASFVLLNSFLPVLVRHHPSLLKEEDETTTSSALQTPFREPSLSSLARNISRAPQDATTPLPWSSNFPPKSHLTALESDISVQWFCSSFPYWSW
jgi:UMF1 family MFS transporter